MSRLLSQTDKWELVNCNLCGSDHFREVCSYGAIKIVKCTTCGFIYRNPRLKENMNREFYSFDYYGGYKTIEEYISNARLPLFKRILSKLGDKLRSNSRKLLDIGCGQGYFLKLAKDLGWQVEGVELAKSACNYAKQEFGIDVVNKSIEEASFKENSFDLITLWNVLDHLLDPLETLREIRQILKPEGLLVIRIPNVNFHLFIHKLFSLIPFKPRKGRFCDPSVIVNYGFSAKTIRKMLEKLNFRDIKILNSPLTFGDPYKSLNILGAQKVNLLKFCLNTLSQSVFFFSFGKIYISSSLIVYCKKGDNFKVNDQ